VTEWVEGRSLTEVFLDWRVRTPETVALARRAGAWLRRFHDCRRLPDISLPVDDMLSALHETFEHADPAFARDKVAIMAIENAMSYSEDVRGIAFPCSFIHGDFKLDNLFLSKDRLIGLDMSLVFEGPVLRDLSPFLNHLDLLLCHPRGWRLAPVRDALGQAFRSGYETPVPARALAWVRLNGVLHVWAARSSRRVSRHRRWYLDRCFRRVVRRLCLDLAAPSASSPRGATRV
jgi:Ser/Thr protein kinase RdoA (MazF antagonist)